ncbi:hypothetical protein [Candidatus Coxiella mudrowiae]|nr:hypothetical protein [Candidatus Coxiella mudrowiae]
MKQYYRIRIRVDEILYPIIKLFLTQSTAIYSRLKVLVKLDISEKGLP